MAALNKVTKKDPIFTHGGARAVHITPQLELRRSVLACMLWEDSFYESGISIAERISSLCAQVKPEFIAELAIEARHKQNLRHVPLLLLRNLVKYGKGPLISETISKVISRADELAEFVSIYWEDKKNKKMLPAQMKKGLALAFQKFSEYQLQKYNKDSKVKLRDVLFLCHAKPKNDEQAALWKKLIAGELTTPDTWEVQLSGGANKKETFERLIQEGKLGYFALIRNLRNMVQASCDQNLVKAAILARGHGAEKILPFRFLAAAKTAPQFEKELDQSMIESFKNAPKLPGKTILIVDVSGSMGSRLSSKSEMTRMDAATALAAIMVGQCEEVVVYPTAGNDGRRIHATKLVPNRTGMAMVDVIKNSARELGGGGIFLKQVLDFVKTKEKSADRIIVFTDEQDCDIHNKPVNADAFGTRNYMLNVSNERNGIGYKPHWLHVDGFSDRVIDFIIQSETIQHEN